MPSAPTAIRQTDQAELERRSLDSHYASTDPSMTLQGPAHDADINTIAKVYGLNRGVMPIPPEIFDPANYADHSEVPDLQGALNLVLEADRQFMRLPPDLRRRFDDNPAVLWNFVNDPRNADEAVKLGLLKRREIVAPEGSQSPPNASGSPAA